MNNEHVEKAVHDVLRCAQAACGLPAQSEVTIRCAMVDAIPSSLGRRAWLPWERQPEPALGRYHRVDYALFDRSGEPTVFIQERPLASRPVSCRPARRAAGPGSRCAKQRGTGFGWTLPIAGKGPVLLSELTTTVTLGIIRATPSP